MDRTIRLYEGNIKQAIALWLKKTIGAEDPMSIHLVHSSFPDSSDPGEQGSYIYCDVEFVWSQDFCRAWQSRLDEAIKRSGVL
jgi:hypothetical protein